jgi:hypothetical protein
MNNNDSPQECSERTVPAAGDESTIVTGMLANPAVVISKLCKRMLSNQEIDDVIRYNLEVILEEIDKIQEAIQVLHASYELKNKHDGDLFSE